MVAQESNQEKKVRFTAPVRRGLAIVRRIALDAFDESKPPAATFFDTLNAGARDDYRRALEWLAQNAEPKGGGAC